MKRVRIDLENCYGIKRLDESFDFSQQRAIALYAPNGVMKSSLAQTFQDYADGVPSMDRIFPTRAPSRKITDENGVDLAKENVFVVRPYDQEFGHTEKTSTLLVEPKLKSEYEQLQVGIDTAKEALLKALKTQSGSKKNLEKEISSAFTSNGGEFYTALTRIKAELVAQKDTPFAEVQYDTIFDERVLAALGTKDVKTAIEDYAQRYNELLAASTFFKKGTFDYYNAGQIAKTLASNGFFDAKHTVNLNASATERLEIRTQQELEDVITKEKQEIIRDKRLRAKFDEVEKIFSKNVTLRKFKSYILDNEAFLSQLTNIDKFKEDVWKSYLKVNFSLFSDLMKEYKTAQARKTEIEEEAAKQRTQWEEVIRIFNERFFVPFKLDAENRTAVMLGDAPIIELGFTYHDGADSVPIEKDQLLKALSMGEKKALYILNIIFEVETRKKAKQETIMIIDDLADSFDYRNKYAIIQYLRDIDQDPLFRQIIMTHNFDFLRTISSRFVAYSHCRMVSKYTTGLSIEQASGIKNVFVNDWKARFFTDPRKKIASIPFIRNLIEFTKGESDASFAKLTSLLHWKADSAAITEAQLDEVFNAMFEPKGSSADGTRPMVEVIQEQAEACINDGVGGVNFENKIVLAIAIRIGAEQFMVKKINDDSFVSTIQSHQTQALVAKFKELFAHDTEAITILDQVALMTPENIHLNAFMYEPIIDMSDEHLRKLYADVLKLQGKTASKNKRA